MSISFCINEYIRFNGFSKSFNLMYPFYNEIDKQMDEIFERIAQIPACREFLELIDYVEENKIRNAYDFIIGAMPEFIKDDDESVEKKRLLIQRFDECNMIHRKITDLGRLKNGLEEFSKCHGERWTVEQFKDKKMCYAMVEEYYEEFKHLFNLEENFYIVLTKSKKHDNDLKE